jgi:transcriptional repressor NrdR
MKCPFCQDEDLKVIDSRNATEFNAVRRRRECLQCSKRFTTFETVDVTVQVLKRNGHYEDFQREKLISGLEAACHHTKISRDQVVAIADKIASQLLEKQLRTISTEELGGMLMKHLQAMDSIAYIRFACVYRRFTEIDELIDAIQSIQSPAKKTQIMAVGKHL